MKQTIWQSVKLVLVVLSISALTACSFSPTDASQPSKTQNQPSDPLLLPTVAATGSAALPTIMPERVIDLGMVGQGVSTAIAMLWLPNNQLALGENQSIIVINIPAENTAQLSSIAAQSAEGVKNPLFLTASSASEGLTWISNALIVQYWSYGQTQDPIQLAASKSPITGLAIAPDAKKIVYSTAAGDIVQIATNKKKDTLEWKAPAWLSDVSYSPDGQRVGGVDRAGFKAYIFFQKGEIEKTIEFPNPTGLPLSGGYFCPNWSKIAWASGSAVQITDLQTGVNGPILNHNDAVSSLAWSSDCLYVATASARMQNDAPVPTLSVWDTTTNEVLIAIPQPNAIQSLSFAPDGERVAVMDIAGQVRLYNLH